GGAELEFAEGLDRSGDVGEDELYLVVDPHGEGGEENARGDDRGSAAGFRRCPRRQGAGQRVVQSLLRLSVCHGPSMSIGPTGNSPAASRRARATGLPSMFSPGCCRWPKRARSSRRLSKGARHLHGRGTASVIPISGQ